MMQGLRLENPVDSFITASSVLSFHPDVPLGGLGHRLMLNQGLDDTSMREAATKQQHRDDDSDNSSG